ncbi:hypothetical protein M1437_04600 [Patescibacteria group bacterium]|nr:hypothetical protein [Patescibacteria group bacterium]
MALESDFSNTEVGSRVLSVLEEVRVAATETKWPQKVNVINEHIPELSESARRLKQTLANSPASRGADFGRRQALKKISPNVSDEFALHIIYLVPGGSPQSVLQNLKFIQQRVQLSHDAHYWNELKTRALVIATEYGFTQTREGATMPSIGTFSFSAIPSAGTSSRTHDWDLANQLARKAFEDNNKSSLQFKITAASAITWETVSHTPGFPYSENPFRLLLDFYRAGMQDVAFHDFRIWRLRNFPLPPVYDIRTALVGHFQIDEHKKGCWAEWEKEVRTFHRDYEHCGLDTSHALLLRDRINPINIIRNYANNLPVDLVLRI